jgi:hypothetical protein
VSGAYEPFAIDEAVAEATAVVGTPVLHGVAATIGEADHGDLLATMTGRDHLIRSTATQGISHRGPLLGGNRPLGLVAEEVADARVEGTGHRWPS